MTLSRKFKITERESIILMSQKPRRVSTELKLENPIPSVHDLPCLHGEMPARESDAALSRYAIGQVKLCTEANALLPCLVV